MSDLPIVEAASSEQPIPENVRILGAISRLLGYPDNHYLQRAEMLYVVLQTMLPEAAKYVSDFGQFVEELSDLELEEAYTRTFDVNPACALEIGWHLFGEDYMRGQFLVRMRGELAKYEIPESSELPDHLTHVLAVIAEMPDDEACLFSHACVFPALHKMQAALDKNQSPYRHLIRCLVLVLEHYYGTSQAWGENDERMPCNVDAYPGKNAPRPPGMGDPLRSYPMPESPCESNIEFVPLQMQYKAPGRTPTTENDIPGESLK